MCIRDRSGSSRDPHPPAPPGIAFPGYAFLRTVPHQTIDNRMIIVFAVFVFSAVYIPTPFLRSFHFRPRQAAAQPASTVPVSYTHLSNQALRNSSIPILHVRITCAPWFSTSRTCTSQSANLAKTGLLLTTNSLALLRLHSAIIVGPAPDR